MKAREMSLLIAQQAAQVASLDVTDPQAMAHVHLAADALLKAKHHLQTASRIEGEE